jgi:Uma2 family endonuclease
MSPATLPLEALAGPSLRDDSLYEVVDGQIVELPSMGAYQNSIASELVYFLLAFIKPKKLGRAVGETLFVLDRAADLKRRPDVAYVSYERWPRTSKVPQTEAWDVVPEVAIEVVSPSNSAEEILEKIREYFQAGCQRVWVVYPKEKQVYVYRSATQNIILSLKDELEGEAVIPGFRLPLADLFEDEV